MYEKPEPRPSISNTWRSSSSSRATDTGTVRPSSIATSYTQSQPIRRQQQLAMNDGGGDTDAHKLPRRPIIATGKKSVAALQQHHQWLMQQQQHPSRMLSPSGSIRSNTTVSSSGSSSVLSARSPSPAAIVEEPDETATAGHKDQQPRIVRTSSQEFRVVREGWLYKKNGLMQWKPVYAVAKHGNAIKPGGLYLYKDDKFSSHIQTYDMSEAVEVEPRAQEYRAGIKWEFRILVKREDVILATDDIASRKAWIDALTSILGKVSMATHSELQSRVTTADQMNRELQASVDNLKAENQQLRDELAAVQDRLKEELEAMHDKNEAREKELDEMDTQYELLRRELSIWRNKTNMLESQLTKKEQECLDTQKEMEEWRKKATELEQAAQEEQDDTRTVKDTIKDVKFSLNSLRDAIKMHSDSQPLVQGHIMDMKSGITKLSDILQEAKSGWTELQAEMTQFMETSKERQTATAALQENNAQESNNTSTSSSRIEEKLNDMLQMMEMLQLSQTRLMTTTMEYVEEERKGIHIDDTRMEAIQSMIQDIQTMLVNNNSQDDGKEEEERQDKFESENRMVEMNGKLEKLLELGKLLQESQDQARQENEKGVDVMGQLFNHIIAQLESSSAVSEQLEQIQERLTSIKAMQETQQKQRLTNGNNAVRTNDAVADAVGNIATSSSAAEELEEMMQSTRGLVERTLRILDKFNSSHMEETVRRAVKTAFNSHWRDVNNNSSSNKSNDESNQQLKRYEENAREYFDKSMSNMRDHLEEYTGVMYRMIEDLILRAVEHLDQSSSSSHATERKQPLQQQQQQEHEQLDKQLAEKKMALKALEAEYEAVQRAQKSLARDLEPLVHQVAKLKQVLSSDDEVGSENSASSYIDLGRRSRPVSPMPSNSTNKVDTTTTTSNQSSARLMAQKPGGGLTGPRRSSFDASAAMQEGGWTMSSRQTQQQNRNSSSSGYSGFLGRK